MPKPEPELPNEADSLKQQLNIDRLALDEEVTRQPVLLQQVMDLLASANFERDRLKEELTTADANLDFEVRDSLKHEKVTEAIVRNAIQLEPKHQQAFDKYLSAKYEADRLAGLKEAFIQRGYLLRDLCSLFVAGYWQEASVKETQATEATHYSINRERAGAARLKRDQKAKSGD